MKDKYTQQSEQGKKYVPKVIDITKIIHEKKEKERLKKWKRIENKFLRHAERLDW